MNINEFVNTFKNANANTQEVLVKNIVKRNYAPVSEKIGMLRGMLEGSIRTGENGIKYIDVVVNKINYVYAIILLYTELEPVKDESGKSLYLETYDLIQQNCLMDLLCQYIGERELDELSFINGQIFDTWYSMNSSTKACAYELVNTVVASIVNILNNAETEENTTNEDKVKEIASNLKDIFEKKE